MDKNDSVIKTTVAVLDPRTCKHQCVTMRTKDFFFSRNFCFRRYVCIKAVEEKLTAEPSRLSGTGPMSNYLER